MLAIQPQTAKTDSQNTRPRPLRIAGRRSLGVNAAFLQEIKDEDNFLGGLLLAARYAFNSSHVGSLNPRATVNLLRRVQDGLAMHFAMEEAFGYFEDALDFPPDLSTTAENRRDEHAPLYLAVSEMVESAERLLYKESSNERTLDRLSSAFVCFHQRLQQHEAGERQLIDSVLTALSTRQVKQ